jgi:hypothetical protein
MGATTMSVKQQCLYALLLYVIPLALYWGYQWIK